MADAKYKASLDGIIEGAAVVVKKEIDAGTKRRKVSIDEKGHVRVVQKCGVIVDFGSEGRTDEVLVPRTAIAALAPQKADIRKAKRKNEAVSPTADTSKLIQWRPAGDHDATVHLVDQVRSALWHLHLSYGSGEKVLGFETADGLPVVLAEASPKKLKLVPYSHSILASPPTDRSYLALNCCVKGSAFQKLYLVDPTETGAGSSNEGDNVTILPFWNAARSGPGARKLTSQMTTVNVSWSATVKEDGFKGGKPPIKIEVRVPFLTNEATIEAGQTLAAPDSPVVRVTTAG